MTVKNIPISELVYDSSPDRYRMDDRSLVESIKENGIWNPISIERGYEVLSGRRRVIAAIKAGLTEVPACIHEKPLEEIRIDLKG